MNGTHIIPNLTGPILYIFTVHIFMPLSAAVSSSSLDDVDGSHVNKGALIHDDDDSASNGSNRVDSLHNVRSEATDNNTNKKKATRYSVFFLKKNDVMLNFVYTRWQRKQIPDFKEFENN